MDKIKFSRNAAIVVVSVVLIAAIATTVITDLIINRAVTWSLIVIASCVFAWFVAVPLLKFHRYGMFVSMSMLTLLIIPLFYAIEYASPAKGWVLRLALPLSLVSIAYLWCAAGIYYKTKMNIWKKTALAVLLGAPVAFFINFWTGYALGNISYVAASINAAALIMGALILFYVGYIVKKRNAVATR